ncbi:(Fe-S)-binding protein [Deinococcus deserti]|uniref:Putative Cysteine-rich domain-containing Fe-S oxidoreductase putative membrane protein n=1 Tax=Deinococcus deserti (strain DSM 17065 / CIP 109153 / LMG 22923 / VCD115) TaxID=546414 RepID=C1CV98_DEIDV|nr:(Fe-S)-binding protein [Deinococcus deserti]ACO46115.1 putative Cysteine-rich domain-containing Fe-S oxidoreductase; putative membrane protein [Deinococcus deserti VCD115]
MLPLEHKILFFVFALIAGALGVWGFYRLYLRIRRGAPSTETRVNNLPARIGYAIMTSLTQERTFRKRRWVSVLHSFIFYGFTYYLLVNVVDALEGYFPFSITSDNPLGAAYNFLADLLSVAVLVGVVSLVARRLWGKSRRDFQFNEKSLLHPLVKQRYIRRDSLIVSGFIAFHVGSRLIGNAAKMVEEARLHGGQYDAFQPFSSALGSVLFGGLSEQAITGWRIFGFWGALGSILAFLSYFPYSKHIHIFMAPLNYALKRPVNTGTLPPMKGLEEAMEQEEPRLGVEKLEDLEWPRLLDAYACIQCNRCQDVCPANATGKALSPAALEINKRMELNVIAAHPSPFTLKPAAFETGASTAHPLLEYAISEEAVWACTTCGACMEVCPVQDEQMLDIIDIRRHQVMVAGEFPAQLQTAFRGMERASNPWGISRDKRMEWAEGLKVPTIDENPEPDVIYWVGCAASYDPGAQKVARAFVQLLDKAGVNYAVLGKKEACTGDSARRAGNEFLYQQLAQENVETLNQVAPKLIVATCPHCMNAIGNEYRQIGGDYRTVHHTEYLEQLVTLGKLPLAELDQNVAYHDPCYLGRHNGVYDAPRTLITKMAGEVLSLERERESSFCCGAGGAQFWKEEEEGRERVSDNRFRELQTRLDRAAEASAEFEQTGKVVAVGCPFCKSMMNSTPEKAKRDDIVVKDVAELMLESVQRATGEWAAPTAAPGADDVAVPNTQTPMERTHETPSADAPQGVLGTTSAETENAQPGSPLDNAHTQPEPQAAAPSPLTSQGDAPVRKSWKPKPSDDVSAAPVQPAPAATEPDQAKQAQAEVASAPGDSAPARKSWKPKSSDDVSSSPVPVTSEPAVRKAWKPKPAADVNPAPAGETAPAIDVATATPATAEPARKAWKPKAPAGAEPDGVVKPGPSPIETSPQAEALAPVPGPVAPPASSGERRKWAPRTTASVQPQEPVSSSDPGSQEPGVQNADTSPASVETTATAAPAERPKWTPKARAGNAQPAAEVTVQAEPAEAEVESQALPALEPEPAPDSQAASGRKKWQPKKN